MVYLSLLVFIGTARHLQKVLLLSLVGKTLVQVNTWNVLNLNCGERCRDMKDHRSYVHNLSSCKKYAWKNFWDSKPWPCDADAVLGAVLHQLRYQANFTSLPGQKNKFSSEVLGVSLMTTFKHNTAITKKKMTERSASTRRWLLVAMALHSYLSKNLFADSKRQIKRSCDVIFCQPRHALVKQRVHCFDVTEITRTERGT